MIATVKPYGREAFDLTLTGEPRATDKAMGGYDTAEVPCVLEPWQHERLLGATLTLSTEAGPYWTGMVHAASDGVVTAYGPDVYLGMSASRRANYIDTRLESWKPWQDTVYGSSDIRPAISPSGSAWWIGLTKGRPPFTFEVYQDAANRGEGISQPVYTRSGAIWLGLTKGVPVQSAAVRGLEFTNDEGITSVAFDFAKQNSTGAYGIRVYRGTAAGTITATPYSSTAGSGSARVDLTGTSTVWVAIVLYNASGGEYTPAAAGHGIAISNLYINGTAVWYKRAGIEYYDASGIQRLKFTWAKKATTAYGIAVYRGDARGTITATAYSNTGTGASVDIDLSATSTVWLAIALQTAAGFTPAVGGHGISITDLQVFGTSVSDPTPYNILEHSLTQVPELSAWMASAQYKQRIASDLPALKHVSLYGNEAAVVADVVGQTGRDFAFRLRDVGGIGMVPVPIYRDRPAEPEYFVTHDGVNVIAELDAGLRESRNRIDYRYKDAAGDEQYGSVASSENYLGRVGVVYAEPVTVNTTSASDAAAAAASVLAAKGGITNGGRVTVRGKRLLDADGQAVHPSLVEAGRVITVSGTKRGEVTGYITDVEHVGGGTVVISLDDIGSIPLAVRRMVGGSV